MAFKDCMMEAVKAGAIDKSEADDLVRRYEDKRKAKGDTPEAGAAAKAELSDELRAEAALKKRQALLQREASTKIADNLRNFRNGKGEADVLEGVLAHLEHQGFAGYSSVEGRMKALVGESTGRLESLLHEARRTFVTGQRLAKDGLDGIVDAAFGKESNAQARAFYDAWKGEAERFRELFNAAGGSIPKLESWALPQRHEPLALLKAGRAEWTDFIKSRLDIDKMRDPLTHGKLSPERLDEALTHVWESIVTDGWNTRAPSQQAFGRGAVGNQRQDHRFLVFKDPAAWREYQGAFGNPDIFATMMDHLRSMARDVSAMQVLGPNPEATITWMKNVVHQERGKAISGKDSLFNTKGVTGSTDAALSAFNKEGAVDWMVDGLWREIRGAGSPVNSTLANVMGGIRNILVSARLGSAVVTAVATDPLIQTQARMLSGLPVAKMAGSILSQFSDGGSKEALRAGLHIDSMMHVLRSEARFAGSVGGPEWTKWLPDRVLTWSGLEPWTKASKAAFGMDFMGFAADHHGTAFDALPWRLRRTLEGYGIKAADWIDIQRAKLHEAFEGVHYLRPQEIADVNHEAGLKYLEMILQETERAVPTGTKRGKSIMMAGTKEGTLVGEAVRSAAMFKSFTASYMMTWLTALSHELGAGSTLGRTARGAAYIAPIVLLGTIAGSLSTQLKQVAAGKDLMDPKDPKFWMAGAAAGGGLGIYSDFLFADHTRFGHSLGETLGGPVIGMAGDAMKIGQSAIKSAYTGKNDVGREAVRFVGQNVPGNSLFYLRAAWNRVVVDQLQYLADPEAHKSFSNKQQNLRRETGQGFWWQPGEVAPDRWPTLATKN